MKPRKAFARLDADVGKLAREHAKANGRTLQSEINFALRASYTQITNLGEWMKGMPAKYTDVAPLGIDRVISATKKK